MYTGTTCIKADVWQFFGMLKRKDHRNNLSDATGAAQHGHNTISRTNKSPSFNSESDRAQMEIKPPRIYIPTKVTLRSHNAQKLQELQRLHLSTFKGTVQFDKD